MVAITAMTAQGLPLFNLAFSLALFPTLAHPIPPHPILHLPYLGLHPSASHAYHQQNAPNPTTASSLIKTKAHAHTELTASLFTSVLAAKVVTLSHPAPTSRPETYYSQTTALLPACITSPFSECIYLIQYTHTISCPHEVMTMLVP